jgi:hypothetical protein
MHARLSASFARALTATPAAVAWAPAVAAARGLGDYADLAAAMARWPRRR